MKDREKKEIDEGIGASLKRTWDGCLRLETGCLHIVMDRIGWIVRLLVRNNALHIGINMHMAQLTLIRKSFRA